MNNTGNGKNRKRPFRIFIHVNQYQTRSQKQTIKMVEIKWTNFAIQNLNDIGDYIEQHSYRQASKMVNYLFDSVSILETFPLSGRIVPEYDTYHVRELIRSNYRIVYLVLNDKRIDILTIHHSAQLLPDLPVLYNNSELSP